MLGTHADYRTPTFTVQLQTVAKKEGDVLSEKAAGGEEGRLTVNRKGQKIANL